LFKSKSQNFANLDDKIACVNGPTIFLFTPPKFSRLFIEIEAYIVLTDLYDLDSFKQIFVLSLSFEFFFPERKLSLKILVNSHFPGLEKLKKKKEN
jgi:hypothetical protein